MPHDDPFWSFETAGWTRYDDAGHYYVPGEKFSVVGPAAFHVAAITDDGEGEDDGVQDND